MKYTVFERFGEMLDCLAQQDIRKAVWRETDEIRPRAVGAHGLEVGPVHEVEVLAYRGGMVYKARVEDGSVAQALAALEARGVELRKVSGNIG